MAEDAFDKYLSEINKAYLRGDATEHTHRPALKELIESLGKKLTATNEPRRVKCGAPDFVVTRRKRTLDEKIGYIECKDIGANLSQAAKTEQIKKRYLPSLHNFILTDYIEFRWYVSGELRLAGRLADEEIGEKFTLADKGVDKVGELLGLFLSQEPERITTAKELAIRMGGMARLMRNVIGETFKQEEEAGTLHGQLEAFRKVLIHDLTEEQFADMYAQTICYGLFTARCHIEDMTVFGEDKYAVFHGMDSRAKELTREHAAYLLPKTNPFFRDIFGDIAGPKLDDRVVWLVDDLVLLLRRADMGVILRDFARRKKRRDPVVHFYETFLAEYNPKLKKKRGIYYTPDEVVSYIVRSVDILLKEKFGLRRGLADESKIKTSKGKYHRLLILDPAVGTGTFLFEVVEQIHKRFRRQKGMWSGYVKEHLLPRIFGFELMMAPYAVAHMKLGLQLAETGYDFESDERLGIYLTNTLEEAEETSRTLFAQYLSREATAANKVKRELPIMVVTGNPPYAGLSANMNDWIEQLLKNKLPGKNGAQSYYEVDGQALGEKKVWLQDDYVKFIRFGQLRIEQSGYGILAFITNHGYLDNPTFRGMRQSLMQTFDEIYVLDLHGNMKKKETCPDGSPDKNVFDIQQGVSIGIFVKKKDNGTPAKIYHADLYGLRKGKYEWLVENDIKTTAWTELSPNSPYYFFTVREESGREEYESFHSIKDIMSINKTGVQTGNEKELTGFSELELSEKLSAIEKTSIDSALLKKYAHKPFDDRWMLFVKNHKQKIFNKIRIPASYRSRYEISKNLVDFNNLALLTGRSNASKEMNHFFVSQYCSEVKCAESNRGSIFCPLYLYPVKGELNLIVSDWPAGKSGRVPNLSAAFVEQLAEKIKLDFVSDGRGDSKKTFGPEDIFHYIYAVFHSPEYRKRYAEFLKIDFPRVPMPKGKPLFRKLCEVGEKLVKLHLLESEILEDEKKWPGFDVAGENRVEKGYPKYVAHADSANKGKVYINKDQFFEGVKPEVWEFHIGGYQVCEKWLKDRRERNLSYEEISHYQKIVVALGETIRLMKEPCLVEMFEGMSSEAKK